MQDTASLFAARVGRNIQSALALAGVSPLELSRQCRAPRGVVVDWLKGRQLTLEALADIADACHLTPEQLVTGIFPAPKGTA